MLDRGLNGYQLYGELSQIRDDIQTLTLGSQAGQIENLQNLKTVKFGVWAQGKVSTQGVITQSSQAVDNDISGGDLDIQVGHDAIIEGIRCEVDNFKIKAENLSITASNDQKNQESYSSEITLTIPIKGNVQGGMAMSSSEGNNSATIYHPDNMIIAKGKLEVDIAGDGKISGVKLQASEVLVRAKNLVVESLQDTLSERMRSMEVSIGSDAFGSLGTKAQATNRDAAWTNAIGSIIGTQVANVVVQQTLEIAGGLIANAEIDENGKLTDKGKAKVEAGSIIAKQLHDYDNGKTFGLGLTLNRKVDPKGNAAWGIGMPVKCSFNESMRDILPTLGQGEIQLTNQGGLEFLNRSLGAHISATATESASLDATVPISDMVEFVQTRLDTSSVETGVAAGGDKPRGPLDSIIDLLKALFMSTEAENEHKLVENHKELLEIKNGTIIEEILIINPKVGDKETNYIFKKHIRTIALEEDNEESLSFGHSYYEITDLKNNKTIIWGIYPEKDSANKIRELYNNTIGQIINIDEKRDEIKMHQLINDYMRETNRKVLFTKGFYLTEEQFNLVKNLVSNPQKGLFFLGLRDCDAAGNRMFESLGIPYAHYQMFTKEELKQAPIGYKISALYGDRQTKITVQGNNIEEIANKYNIQSERIVKKYNMKPYELDANTVNQDILFLNMMKDREYEILPPSTRQVVREIK